MNSHARLVHPAHARPARPGLGSPGLGSPGLVGATAAPSRRSLLRAVLLAGGLGATGAALSGCGSASAQEPLPASSKASLDGATLRLMVNQPHVVAFKDLLAPAFEKEFGGRLEVTAIPYDQLTAKQILDVTGGAGEFDVFDYFYFGLGSLVDAGALVDLTDYVGANEGADGIDTADFLPSIYDPYTLLDGKRYGLPFDGDTHVLFYNTAIFEKVGVEPPTTWDEYDAAAATITAAGGGEFYGAAVQGQQVPVILGCSFVNRLAGYGGSLVDADGNPTLTSDEAVTALEHLVAVSPSALPTPLQVGFDEANTGFLSGKAAMIDTWTDLGLKAQQTADSKIKDSWDAVPLPVGGSNTTPRTALESGFGLGVSTGSQQPEVAAAFVAWATSAKQNLLLASTGGSGIDPARASVLSAPGYAEVSAPITATIAAGLKSDPLVWPRDRDAPKKMQDFVDQLALALDGTQDVTTSLKKAQDSWEKSAGA